MILSRWIIRSIAIRKNRPVCSFLPMKGQMIIERKTITSQMTDKEKNDLQGKTVLITGSTSGLGLHTAKAFYRRGATVILTCRDNVRGRNAINEVLEQDSNTSKEGQETVQSSRVQLYELDVTDYKSVLHMSEELKSSHSQIDVLICNAGKMGGAFELSSDGVELHFATNHFGHFVLVNQLLPLLAAAKETRVILISSGFYKRATGIPTLKQLLGEEDWEYEAKEAYSISKLANCLHAKALARRLEVNYPTVKVFAVRPGFVRGTELGRETHWLLRRLAAPLIWFIARSLDEGIRGYMHTATSPIEALQNGALYFDEKVEEYVQTVTEEKADELWKTSVGMEELIRKRRSGMSQEEKDKAKEASERLPVVLLT